ncbi:MAG: hypothetical protein ACKOCX_13695 [Planctomycetota bacterium]
MVRLIRMSILALAVLAASTRDLVAQQPFTRVTSSRPAAGGLLGRLNRSPFPTPPGMPTASPLGLIAPRLSNMVSIVQLGGFKSQAGRLAGLGVISPRISPVAALLRTPPATRQDRLLYGLTILSPRAAVLVAMLRATRTQAAGFASFAR